MPRSLQPITAQSSAESRAPPGKTASSRRLYRAYLGDQHLRERCPTAARDPVFAERLYADVVGARVEVRVHDLRDFLCAALRDDCVDQPVRSAVSDVVRGEAGLEQVLHVV